MQDDKLVPKLFVSFVMLRIDDDRIVDRANALASRFIIMTDALGAAVAINFVDFSTHRDRLIRAFWLAHIAIDAFFCDKQGHNFSRVSNNPVAQYSRFDPRSACA